MRRMFSLEQLKGIADSRVQALIEGGTLENAKPIYCHPIYFDCNFTSGDYAGRRYYFTCLIFNNEATPFTLSTFLAEIQRLCNLGAKIMITGGAFYDNITLINSCIKNVSENNACIYGLKVGTNNDDYVSLSIVSEQYTTFEDGVNKIN